MMRKTLKRLLIVLLAIVSPAVLPLRAGAQNLDARTLMRARQQGENTDLFGSNPYETTEEDGSEVPDTTRKERRPRKPLESYFFDDSLRARPNFAWTIDRDFNRVHPATIDTMLTDFRIDYPFYVKGAGDAAIGGLGQGSLPLNYFDRPRYADFELAQPYHSYIYDMENVPFYNVKKPMIRFTYFESGQKRYREEQFRVMTAQNISPSTGFNVNYKSRGTRGKYPRSRTKNHNFSGAVNHTGKRYSLHAGYINNRIEAQENGGVVGDWAIADTTFEMNTGVPMRLADAEAHNSYRNNAFFVEQSYGIPLLPVTERDFSIAALPVVFVGHSFEYNAWSRVYSDKRAPYTDERGGRDEHGDFVPVTRDYYDNWYLNPTQTRDSISERVISNRLFVQVQPWNRDGVVGTIDGGVGLDLHTWSQFAPGDYVSGRYAKTKKTSWFAYGAIDGKIRRYVDWGADVKFYPSGYRGGDLSFGARLALTGYIRRHPLILEGRFSMDRRSPTYWQEHYVSNHFMWDAPLDKENETRLEVRFSIPDFAFEAGAWQGVVNDKIYYGADACVAQKSGSVSLTSVYVRKDFRVGGFHFDHRVLLQWSTDQAAAPVPLLSAYLSYYYEFWVKRDVLRLQAGFDGRYTTEYYAPGYNPALAQFYNQREVKVGNYPYVDAYVTAKWKRMRIFLKYQHLNKGLFGNGRYFSVAHYPLMPGMFKMGISWGFYD